MADRICCRARRLCPDCNRFQKNTRPYARLSRAKPSPAPLSSATGWWPRCHTPRMQRCAGGGGIAVERYPRSCRVVERLHQALLDETSTSALGVAAPRSRQLRRCSPFWTTSWSPTVSVARTRHERQNTGGLLRRRPAQTANTEEGEATRKENHQTSRWRRLACSPRHCQPITLSSTTTLSAQFVRSFCLQNNAQD